MHISIILIGLRGTLGDHIGSPRPRFGPDCNNLENSNHFLQFDAGVTFIEYTFHSLLTIYNYRVYFLSLNSERVYGTWKCSNYRFAASRTRL